MKFIKTIAIVALIFAAGNASAQSVADKWPAMKAFHEVMSRTFHPAEEGNFEPLKTYSESLMNKAMDLTKEVPAQYKTKSIMDSVSRLQEKTKEVNKLVVGKGPDSSLLKAITEAHDIFHEIVGMCSGEKH